GIDAAAAATHSPAGALGDAAAAIAEISGQAGDATVAAVVAVRHQVCAYPVTLRLVGGTPASSVSASVTCPTRMIAGAAMGGVGLGVYTAARTVGQSRSAGCGTLTG